MRTCNQHDLDMMMRGSSCTHNGNRAEASAVFGRITFHPVF